MRRARHIYLLIFILVFFFNLLTIIETKSASPILYVDDNNIIGPWDGSINLPYRTIQDAYDNSTPFDKIFVFNGTYTTTLNINHSIVLMGEEKSSTIIHGLPGHITLSISANHTNITGFTLRNSPYGIQIKNASNVTISNNNFKDLQTGIQIDNRSQNNIIYNNNFLKNTNHAIDQGKNAWDIGLPNGGNYWDTYIGIDENQDGLGDTPFVLPEGLAQDQYPHIYPITPPPIAAFFYSPDTPYTIDPIDFTDLSTDSDGGITTWFWEFGDGNTSHKQDPIHTYTDDGAYTITLTVTDYYGVTDQISQTITILNVPPTPLFDYIPKIPTDLDTISFNDASTDDDGTITNWKWDFGDGNNSTKQHPTHQYADNGTYIISLQVTDNDNATQEISQLIEIKNVPPIAQFTLNPAKPILDDTIIFQDVSIDLDGKISIWSWEFGDDTTSTNRSPTYRYKKEGTYTIILQVMDNDGALATVEKTVIIIDDKPAEEIPAVSILLYSIYVAFFIAMIAMVLYIKKRFG